MVVSSVISTLVVSIKFIGQSNFLPIYPPLHIHPTVISNKTKIISFLIYPYTFVLRF
jgi:hypothetical protein